MANRKKSKYQPTRVEMKAALHHLRRLIEFRTDQSCFEQQVRLRAAARFVAIMDERMELDAEGAAV